MTKKVRDEELLAIVAEAWKRGSDRAGDWLVCRLGCSDCCMGPFAITALDAWRLRKGMARLKNADYERWERLHERAIHSAEHLARHFPGDLDSRLFAGDEIEESRVLERFAAMPCPALDPETHLCDLYDHRPISCRTFGLPVTMGGEDLAPCTLCFRGAAQGEIERCRVRVGGETLESELVHLIECQEGNSGETLVVFALLEPEQPAGPGPTSEL